MKKEQNSNINFFLMVFCLFFLYQYLFTAMSSLSIPNEKIVAVDDITYNSYVFDTDLTCINSELVYTIDGLKVYNVLFFCPDLQRYFNCEFSEKEMEGLDLNGKFQSRVNILYISDVLDYFFRNRSENFEIKSVLKSDKFKGFYDVAKIDFMFSDKLEDFKSESEIKENLKNKYSLALFGKPVESKTEENKIEENKEII